MNALKNISAKSILVSAGILSIIIGMKAQAVDFGIHGITGYNFGETRYTLAALVQDPNSPSGLTQVRSELSFPLDAPLSGFSISASSRPGTFHPWRIEASLLFNLDDPRHALSDDDWIAGLQILHIESVPQMRWRQFSAQARYQLWGGSTVGLSGVASFAHQILKQEMIGYTGWQYDFLMDGPVPVSDPNPAINYDLTYNTPQLGLMALFSLSRFTSLSLQSTAGLVFAKDRDDHLLRGKLATADAVGFGLSGELQFSLLPGFALGQHFSLNLFGQFRYFHAEGEQTQSWYKDDYGTPAGTVISGIPHEFISYQFLAGLQAGWTF